MCKAGPGVHNAQCTLSFVLNTYLLPDSHVTSVPARNRPSVYVQEDPGCLFAWCDVYTLVCTLRGCLLARTAVFLPAQGKQSSGELHERSKWSSTDHDVAVEHDDLGSSNLLHLIARISDLLQTIVAQSNKRILQPLCQRSIEETLSVLSRVTESKTRLDVQV